jgi:predicted TPR repeat methyltransferase
MEKPPKSTIDQAIDHLKNLKSYVKMAMGKMSNLSKSNIEAGVLQLRNGQFFDAALRFRIACYVDKNNPIAHYLLGKALVYDKKFDKAAPALKRAIKLNPEMAEAKFLLATCGYKVDFAQIPKSFIIERHDILSINYAGDYEVNVSAELLKTLREKFKEYFEEWQGFGVLDLGCRGGEFGSLLKNKANIMVGVEPSIKMSALAKARRAGTDLVYNKVFSKFPEDYLATTEDTYNVIICTYYLDYLSNLEEFFKAVRARIHKTGGVFIFNICSGPDAFNGKNILFTHSEETTEKALTAVEFKVAHKLKSGQDIIYFAEI